MKVYEKHCKKLSTVIQIDNNLKLYYRNNRNDRNRRRTRTPFSFMEQVKTTRFIIFEHDYSNSRAQEHL